MPAWQGLSGFSGVLPRKDLRHRIAAPGDFELREDLLEVKLDGVIRDPHAARDYFVGEAFREMAHDLAFTQLRLDRQ